MRVDEIASAEDQIALFKLITDKVWQSLGDQQRAEAEDKAAQPLKAKLTAKTNTRASTAKRITPAKPKQAQPKKTLTAKYQKLPQPQTPKQQVQPAKQSNTTNPSFDSKSQNMNGISSDDRELI